MRDDDREQFEAGQAAMLEHQLTLGREMVSAACGGHPDFDGFIAALRSEAMVLGRIWRANEKQADIAALIRLADEIERFGQHYGYL